MAPSGLDLGRNSNNSSNSRIASQISSTTDGAKTKKCLFYKDTPYQDIAYVPTILHTTQEKMDFFDSHFKGKPLKYWRTTKEGKNINFTTPADCEKPMMYYRENYESFYHYLEMSLSPKGKKGDIK